MEEKTSINNSIGVINGNNNYQKIEIHNHKESKSSNEFNVPVDDNLNFAVISGRWLLKRLGEKKFVIIFSILALLSILPTFAIIIFLSNNTSILTNLQNYINFYTIILFVILILTFGYSSSLLFVFNSRTCKNCKRRMGYRERERKHIGQDIYRDKIIHKLKQFLVCDYCSNVYEHEFPDIEEIEKK